ncbi:MAG: AAA family ATPase [Acidobacteria bacterium]|nr:AAA family ATPase [Acidobacteriota bacterium]
MGDGALAYFGYPRAHEDDAERAVRAGLNLVQVISKLHTPDGQSLAARIGIATGLVVVGDLIGEGAAQEEAVVGETPNLAARLQTLAEPGSVVIGGGTRRLLGDLFELDDLGRHSIRGFAEPVPVWRAVSERAAGSRFEAVRGQRLTRFVSRGDEVSLLLDRWQQAKEGEGQVVLLSGEAGIGKSRITQVLMERVHNEPHVRLRYQCSPHHINTALHPFTQQLSHAAGLSLDGPIEAGLDKLEQLLVRDGDDLSQTVPLIAELLSIPTSDRYPPLDLTPPQRKSATFDALLDQLAGLAAVDPVLVLFEDMHWADPTSRELWDLVVARIASLPVLAVITFRPEFDPPWGDYGNVTALSLNRLGRRHSAAMVANQCDGKDLPAALLDQILDQADGIPLFLEELTTAVLSSDLVEDTGERYALTAPLGSLSIPATLQDSLLARLDRLAPVKEVAQLGATIGRTFGHELLAAVAQLDETALGKALDELVEAGIVQLRGMSPSPRYAFKHALVRDAAYQSLLKSTRRQYHLRIARALERHFPVIVENEPEVAAHHCTEAGLASEAAILWERAGRRALEFSAYLEAIDHFEHALAGVLSLPPDHERDGRELELQLALGTAWIPAKAYSADEVRRAYATAVELSRRVGNADQRFAALRGLWNNHLMRVELNAAKELAVQLRTTAEESGDAERRLVAERAAGSGLMALGEHREANACFHRGLGLYDPQHHHHYVQRYGEDPGIWCYCYAAWTDDWLGHRDRALDESCRAVEIARELPTPLTLVIALSNAALVHQFRREVKATLACAEETMRISDELGIVQLHTWASIHKGWALASAGQTDAGLAEIEEGLATWRAIGGLNNRTHFLNLLADACRLAGRPEAGMAALDEAEEIAASVDLHAHGAETRRRRGELHLALGRAAEAESSWLHAIDFARSQGAKTLELRAATNLAGLWRDQDRNTEARELLAPLHSWFTEGFDTPDLREAKALLDELDQ